MNIFVLKAMRYLDNPELFTKDEMWENATAADAAIGADVDYDAADTAADVAADAFHAADCADFADYDYWIDEYFKKTGEDRQTYINEVERLR
tara:strand:+ start:2539 stop:2814 length:276 start_codon:yes stop_codon:yes gene_type:complete